MTHNEMRNYVLLKLHKSLDDWYLLVGEFCDNTAYFTVPYVKNTIINDKKYTIVWNGYSGWAIV